MTVAAHNGRRVWGGASLARNVEAGTAQRASLHKLLHPQMYKDDYIATPSIPKRHAMIMAYLRENGPATAPTMETAYRLRRDTIAGLLRNGVAGVVVIRKERSPITGRMCIVWGLQDIHTSREG